jgi:hypothetical protein
MNFWGPRGLVAPPSVRGFTRCRVAYIIDGREGYAPWRPIAEYEALRRGAARVQTMGEIRAWVERR